MIGSILGGGHVVILVAVLGSGNYFLSTGHWVGKGVFDHRPFAQKKEFQAQTIGLEKIFPSLDQTIGKGVSNQEPLAWDVIPKEKPQW